MEQAFALEQCGSIELAQTAGRRAVDIYRGDVWAHHAVAHALYFAGKLADGVRWMQSLQQEWVHLCSFMLTHNWWHVALFQLDMGA